MVCSSLLFLKFCCVFLFFVGFLFSSSFLFCFLCLLFCLLLVVFCFGFFFLFCLFVGWGHFCSLVATKKYLSIVCFKTCASVSLTWCLQIYTYCISPISLCFFSIVAGVFIISIDKIILFTWCMSGPIGMFLAVWLSNECCCFFFHLTITNLTLFFGLETLNAKFLLFSSLLFFFIFLLSFFVYSSLFFHLLQNSEGLYASCCCCSISPSISREIENQVFYFWVQHSLLDLDYCLVDCKNLAPHRSFLLCATLKPRWSYNKFDFFCGACLGRILLLYGTWIMSKVMSWFQWKKINFDLLGDLEGCPYYKRTRLTLAVSVFLSVVYSVFLSVAYSE